MKCDLLDVCERSISVRFPMLPGLCSMILILIQAARLEFESLVACFMDRLQ